MRPGFIISGKLTQGFTVHHKTPVLIQMQDIKPAK